MASGCLADKGLLDSIPTASVLSERAVSGNIKNQLADVQLYKQDALYYADKIKTFPKIPKDIYQLISQSQTRKLLWPWHGDFQYPATYLSKQINALIKDPFYAENLLPVSKDRLTALVLLANPDAFPNVNKKAITLVPTNLRLLPTTQPLFYNPILPGEGFPFDMLQNSSIPAGIPLFVLHQSLDKAWAYVVSSYAEGWIPLKDLAFVEDRFVIDFESHPWVTLVKDQIPLYNNNGDYLYHGSLGMQFPLLEESETQWKVLAAAVTESRNASIIEICIPKEAAQPKPYALTPTHIAELANQLLGQPYGWGGLYQNRDCASMIQDLFIPFGIWLPRNGNAQGLDGGVFVSLKGLSASDKETMIIRNGIPFLTLLWFRGHIMLYVGTENGKALVLHNIWGIRTKSDTGKEGRYIIGKTVITSLEPGKELSDTDPNRLLLDRVEGFTLLVPRYE